MKKKFRITVNGVSYDVEVEEIPLQETSAPVATISKPSVPVVKPPIQEQKPVSPSAPSAPVPVAAEEGSLTAPIAGKVVRTLKKVSDTVKTGETILLLEAMKMENEITSKMSGTITFIVEEGAQVAYGDVLVVIK
ncbi:MAG: biotin/lipoyl-containing protein [Promethearchaeota archaeon]